MEHFNQLTPAEAERLAILAEECGEVVQVIGKILRHGYESCHPDGGPTNRMLLEKETGDVQYAIERLIGLGDISADEVCDHRDEKYKKVRKYLHHQNNH